MKELRFDSPNKKHPGTFKPLDLLAGPEDEIEVIIEWADGTYGSRVPMVVLRKVET